MIPLRLTIKNFLSYGADAQTINFEPYNLICLSGKNGHGKSALLDAMTWSIWGQARKLIKRFIASSVKLLLRQVKL
jgi:exonuclease SbcC